MMSAMTPTTMAMIHLISFWHVPKEVKFLTKMLLFLDQCQPSEISTWI